MSNRQFSRLAILAWPAASPPNSGVCPYCQTEFPIEDYFIGDIASQGYAPVCNICAWDRAPNLMQLIQFYKETARLTAGLAAGLAAGAPIMPETVREELSRRANDPERLKCELQEALEWLGRGARVKPPLAKLLAGEVKAALDSGDVKKMREAEAMVNEVQPQVSDLDDEIPF